MMYIIIINPLRDTLQIAPWQAMARPATWPCWICLIIDHYTDFPRNPWRFFFLRGIPAGFRAHQLWCRCGEQRHDDLRYPAVRLSGGRWDYLGLVGSTGSAGSPVGSHHGEAKYIMVMVIHDDMIWG